MNETITTAAELDALPHGSVVIDCTGKRRGRSMSETTLPTVSDVAHSLAMSYGAHVNAPEGGRDWRAAENLMYMLAGRTEAVVKAEALRELAYEVQNGEVWTWDADRLCGFLRDRADRIESET